MTDDVLDRTRAFVRENFLYTRPEFDLKDEQPLMEAGVIDSMGVMELLEFIENEFGVNIDDSEITEENLGTLNAIAGFVAEKRNGTAGAA